ncbi:cytochrome p450 pisatin [Colletotrichum chrysophilum]|uniref:Cytochrome p450 pisatin n=1 Tax=Colletotrichum chrysophilum TaxID=1836956 RepID=A0AAD9EBH9_9PEZI|nr:cytochrome p450 pisatin [Colletotrichum chrysophilum]
MILPIHGLEGRPLPPLWWAIPFAAFAVLLYRIISAVRDPLRHIPGPFLARFTRLWLFRQYYRADYEKTDRRLHEKYGPIVRIAPGQYSIDSLDAAKTIYGHGSHFAKNEWYLPWGNPALSNLFNELNPKVHSAMRRQVANVYSMSNMVSYEPYVDECTDIFAQRFSEISDEGRVIDLGHWFQCYALDVIGKITFSKRFGCLDDGGDPQGVIKALDEVLTVSTLTGVYPRVYPYLFSVLMHLGSGKEPRGNAYIVKFSRDQVAASRVEEKPKEGPQDFISKLLQTQKERPELIDDASIQTAASTNVGAGSDTTAISLSAIMYYLCRNPGTLEKLRKELDNAEAEGSISNPITFREAQALPYLQAVIKESLRLHPATGLTMPRVVPEGGRQLAGAFFPAGNVVGINAWIAHHNKEVFGHDADDFRPERWIDSSKEQKSAMESYFFAFGQGSRTCIGKNISLLEVSKAIPRVVQNFDLILEKEDDWKCTNYWFVKPRDFFVRVKKRGSC